jgi:uncharacterized OB-fold protein
MASETFTAQSWDTDPYVTPWPEMRPFWEAAAAGRFLMPRCEACGQYHWHPRAVCPFCRSNKIAWIETAGRGTIFSYSVARTGPAPEVVAFVKTSEGPIILSKIVESDVTALRIGLPVHVKLIPVDGGRSMPFFTVDR